MSKSSFTANQEEARGRQVAHRDQCYLVSTYVHTYIYYSTPCTKVATQQLSAEVFYDHRKYPVKRQVKEMWKEESP